LKVRLSVANDRNVLAFGAAPRSGEDLNIRFLRESAAKPTTEKLAIPDVIPRTNRQHTIAGTEIGTFLFTFCLYYVLFGA
jgi:hypothetical protein